MLTELRLIAAAIVAASHCGIEVRLLHKLQLGGCELGSDRCCCVVVIVDNHLVNLMLIIPFELLDCFIVVNAIKRATRAQQVTAVVDFDNALPFYTNWVTCYPDLVRANDIMRVGVAQWERCSSVASSVGVKDIAIMAVV